MLPAVETCFLHHLASWQVINLACLAACGQTYLGLKMKWHFSKAII